MVDPGALAELQTVCPGAVERSETGRRFIDLPGLKIPVGKESVERDALLALQADGSYTSRLYLSEPISGRGVNWTHHTILGRSWHTPSWQGVQPGRPVEMLLQHLGAYR
jgi:hypothetical protein